MTCSDFLDRYSDFDDSLLTPTEEAVFRAHLEACLACARYDRVLRKGRMLARQLATEPAPDFVPRLRRRILSESTPPLEPLRPVAAGGFLTLMLAAVAGFWLVDGGSPIEGLLDAGDAPAPSPDRFTSLPVTAWAAPDDWTTGGVDRRAPSSYSPLVIGPPAYRAHRSATTSLTSATRQTLD